MLIALPALTLALLVIEELGRATPGDRRPWHGSLLVASAIFGAVLVGITETLSLFHGVRQAPMAVAWLAVALLVYFYGWRRNLLNPGWARLIELTKRNGWVDWVLLALFTVLVVLVVSVALVSPPNNVDSLQYHMPRVVHWAQDGSLDHFATPYNSQDSRPYWAELAILDLRVLWGNDTPASLPQVFCLLGIVVAAAGAARLLGGDRRTQILAGLLAFGVPMGLLQATTQKNDVASSFWVMSAAYFVILEHRGGLTPRERWTLFVSVALAMLTKGTAIPFVAGLVLWYCVIGVRRIGVVRLVIENAPAIFVVVLLNGPFWYRNVVTYGGPFGSSLPLVRALPSGLPMVSLAKGAGALGLVDWPAEVSRVGEALGGPLLSRPAAILDPAEFFGRWVRMAGMHFVTPFHAVNEVIFRAMRRDPTIFPDSYVFSLEFAAWNHEMTAGNPLHVLLGAGAFGALFFARRRTGFAPLAALSLAATLGLFLISFAGCSDVVFCMRYQLGFFYLAAPVIAVVVYRVAPRAVVVAGVLALAYAAPYVLINNMRPVVGIPPWPTRIRSVFVESPNRILFAQSPEVQDEYEYVASRIQDAACKEVGLVTSYPVLEYTFWRLLGAPQSGVRIEHLSATPGTKKYLEPDFQPCAVISTDSSNFPENMPLPLSSDFGHVRLYLEPPD